MASDLISREAAIAEIEEYIEEYSELEPETGYHSLKWCAMEEAKDTLLMLPAIDAIPADWLKQQFYDNLNSQWAEKCRDVFAGWQKWQRLQKEQEGI